MTTRMLIDARHREETRVAVVKGNRIEEFDFESAERKQLKGNIYLAKVTRVEPSLQAAFIDYGGNRHGFLAFSEIHPDYYQIPREDREALLREEAEHAAEEAALRAEQDGDDDIEGDVDSDEDDRHDDDGLTEVDDHADDEEAEGHDDAETSGEDAPEGGRPRRRRRERSANDEAADALRERRMNLRRRYKIQDVIRRRQVLLVQVVKEERGNKGAALTTYLSLAGRYCVLMPNTSHGGGISRKISNAGDRKRLKSIMSDLQLPPSMGCIVRTAGLQRTKVEIKRDFDYLARLWDEIRDKTLQSSAPALVYGDSDLMKRAIRDIYNREIDEVIVEGEDGYRQAKDFMRLLMPSHARRVKHYSDPVPLFQRAGVEDQLSAMYHPVVQLKSGGYLVINPTEALVSIDINSGRSTREHNIEQTATATNLEATYEIARQLRLRDMAGLVVIDFIDMDHGGNVRKVEKAMKDALKNDRARIQVGRISSFGLMEMSRQRLRTGVLEASTRSCPHCEGTGLVRTASSAGLSALRLLEDEAARGRGSELLLRASQEAALYVLNRKRAELAEIEDRYGVLIEVASDGEQEGARMTVEVSGPPPAHAPRFDAPIEDVEDEIPEEIELDEEEDAEDEDASSERDEDRGEQRGEGEGGKRRRRRRGRGRRSREEGGENAPADGEGVEGVASDEDDAEVESDDTETEQAGAAESGEEAAGNGRRRRRRGRRGGRRDGGDRIEGAEAPSEIVPDALVEAGDSAPVTGILPVPDPEAATDETPAEPSRRSRRRPRARADAAPVVVADTIKLEVAPEGAAEEAPPAPAKPKRSRRKAASSDVEAAAPPEAEPAAPPEAEPAASVEAESVAPVERNGDVLAAEPGVEAVAEKPRRRAPRRKAAADPVAETATVDAEGVPDEVAPAADEAPANEADVVPAKSAAELELDEADPGEVGTPRRGWWQRTFGA